MDLEEVLKTTDGCADLVTYKSNEPYVKYLLSIPSGQWERVTDTLLSLPLIVDSIQDSIFAAWLPCPGGDEDYVLILFYDTQTMDELVAVYNRTRLFAQS